MLTVKTVYCLPYATKRCLKRTKVTFSVNKRSSWVRTTRAKVTPTRWFSHSTTFYPFQIVPKKMLTLPSSNPHPHHPHHLSVSTSCQVNKTWRDLWQTCHRNTSQSIIIISIISRIKKTMQMKIRRKTTWWQLLIRVTKKKTVSKVVSNPILAMKKSQMTLIRKRLFWWVALKRVKGFKTIRRLLKRKRLSKSW